MREANTALAEALRACAKDQNCNPLRIVSGVLNDREVQALRLPRVARISSKSLVSGLLY
jgi:hypothetical protein